MFAFERMCLSGMFNALIVNVCVCVYTWSLYMDSYPAMKCFLRIKNISLASLFSWNLIPETLFVYTATFFFSFPNRGAI